MVRGSKNLVGTDMLSFFRALLDTWAARLFFVVLVAAFGLWGIGDVVRNVGHDTALATVGSRKIEPPEFQDGYRRGLAEVQRMMGTKGEVTQAIRKTVADQTLDRLVMQDSIADEVDRLGLIVPDDTLRRAVFETPAFRGPSGAFDRNAFNAVLRNNNLTEGRFLELTRAGLAQQQLLGSVQTGIAAPQTLLNRVYSFEAETRAGEIVELPFAAAAPPPAPTDDDLQRQYENNPAIYSAPEYRRIKLVVLSPQTLARGVEVSDDEIKAYYDTHQPDYHTEEQRAADVIAAPDEATAQKLAAAWQAGADWASMQQAAKDSGANSVALDLSVKQQIPAADLADAIFAAAPDVVAGPVKSAFGWNVIRVTKVQPGVSRTLDQVKDEVKNKIALDRGTDEVFARANKLDDALSAGTSLDDLPGDLGLAAVAGTLDAHGKTPEGEDAPIPGTPELRQAILTSAFAATKGEAPRMIEGPGQSYYALQVEDVTPAKVEPFDEVKAQVAEDWTEAQKKREQEVKTAQLMTAAQAGGSLDDAATIAGLRLETTQPVTRNERSEHVAPDVQQALFRLKPNETTMVETAEGFIVIRLTDVKEPDPAADPAAAAQLREALDRSLAQDITVVFATGLRDRAQPRVNRTMLDSLVE